MFKKLSGSIREVPIDTCNTALNNVVGLFKECLVCHLTVPSYGRMKQACRAFYFGLRYEHAEKIKEVTPGINSILRRFVGDASSIDREKIQKVIDVQIYGLALNGNYSVAISQNEYENYLLKEYLRKYSDQVNFDYVNNLSDESRNQLLDSIVQLNDFYEEFSNLRLTQILDRETQVNSLLVVIKTLLLDYIPLSKIQN